MNEVIAKFEKELSECKQKPNPMIWSSPEGNLGFALIDMQSSDLAKLKQSIDAFKEELEGISQKDAPKKWGEMQLNLADALHALGQQEKEDSISVLNESMEAYKNILMVCKRQDNPLLWALILNNVGMIFQTLGERSEGSHTMMKSISAFNNALTIRTADETPLEFAVTLNNFAASLQLLAESKQDEKETLDVLEESLKASENAIQNIQTEQNPLGWLISLSNFYATQRILAERTKNTALAQKSVENAESVVSFLATTSNAEYLNLAQIEKEKSEEVLKAIT